MDKVIILPGLEGIIGKENIFYNEPMKKHTTMRVGGVADIYARVHNSKDMQKILELDLIKNKKVPITVIGNGSNVIVKDNGIRGLVINYDASNFDIISNINPDDENEVYVIAESGVMNVVLAHKLMENSISGFEFAAGIPGTIGGAIAMNAGAFSGEMKNIVEETTYIDFETNEIKKINNIQHQFGHRTSIFESGFCKGLILKTKLNLYKKSKEEIVEKMEGYKQRRLTTQPLDMPNSGSTFKRSEKYITAKLIDDAGLKGYSIGGAMVSTKHAGFIVNYNNATASDVIELIRYVQDVVYEKFGYKIEPEVRIIGE